jgi:DNA-binding response OmpR family regulator
MTTATANRAPRALLLDDDATVLRLLGTALEARGFGVRAAADAESGLSLLVDELLDLDVLVVDADLPGRDARAVLHLVRWAGGERELGVVVLATDLDAAGRAELLALGADAVVDRRAGHAAALDVITAAVRPARPAARSVSVGARPSLAGALLLPRPALDPSVALA